eukprot:TRINITY_DN21670_c0_g1_i1.p1 TRINITY_DN21670_c0_g1~~TRINITY_DN21670_c0_g1_i1.p1  ORF type:complete len:224 (-),score=49.68 TRINITY_DN21670_c0_g1_i1:83-754(-)
MADQCITDFDIKIKIARADGAFSDEFLCRKTFAESLRKHPLLNKHSQHLASLSEASALMVLRDPVILADWLKGPPLLILERFLKVALKYPAAMQEIQQNVILAHCLVKNGCSADFRPAENGDVNKVYHVYPLHLAAQEDKVLIVDFLVQLGAEVNALDSDGRTALHYALAKDSAESAMKLIQAGCNSAVVDRFGDTAMDIAVSNGFYLTLLQLKDLFARSISN